jgi:uncharacterized caspase-like protein
MHMARQIGLLALALLALLQAGPSAAEKRVALVIGNGTYAAERMRLANPTADAALVSRTLRELGFAVDTVLDAGKETMEDAVGRFAQQSRDADVALFYYAGHALQDLGKNFLMPVDGFLKSEQDLRRRFVRLDDVLADLSAAKGARIVILDACRDNDAVEALRAVVPQTRSTGVSRGLAAVPKVSGMLVAFATQPDRVAADGIGANSPFAQALARRFVEPGVELRTVLTRVRQDVATATANAQVPEVSDSLLGELYLRQSAPAAAAGEVAASPLPATDGAVEAAFWSSVERLGTKTGYQSYLARFGKDGIFASLAEEKIAALDASAPPAAASPTAPAQFAAPAPEKLASLPPAVAPAQSAGTRAGAALAEWAKVCNTDPASKKRVCLVSRDVRSETGQTIASVALREIEGDPKRHFLVALQPSFLLQPGILVSVDQRRPLPGKFSACFSNACYAEVEVKSDFLSALKKGRQVIVEAMNQQAKPIPSTAALTGIAQAYDGPPRAGNLSKVQGAPAPN